jgi:hypothetical protein
VVNAVPLWSEGFWYLVPTLAAAAIYLALAVAVLFLGFSRPVIRAFALFLFVSGVGLLLISLAALYEEPSNTGFWSRVGNYFALALPVTFAWFISLYPSRRRWLLPGRWAPVPFLALAALMLGMYAYDHHLYMDERIPWWQGQEGFLADIYHVAYIVMVAAAPLFAWDYFRGVHRDERRSLILFSLAIAMATAYYIVPYVWWLSTGVIPLFRENPHFAVTRLTQQVGEMALLLLTAGIVAWNAVRNPDHRARKTARRYLVALAVPALLALWLVSDVSTGTWLEGMARFLNGFLYWFWDVVIALVLTYCVASQRMLGSERLLKWTIRRGTLAAIFLGVLFVTTEIAQNFFSAELGWAAGGVVTGLVLLAAVPLQRFADRVANAALPNVQDSDDYIVHRKSEMYRAALEDAGPAANRTANDREFLAQLKDQLQISDQLAARLEVQVFEAARRSAPPGSTALAAGADSEG